MINRRACLQTLAATTVSAAACRFVSAKSPDAIASRIWIFTKPIQELSFTQAADWLEKWDVGGVEATVRSGGWIDPQDAGQKLPRMMDALARVNRAGVILSSDVNAADSPDIDRVLRVASQLGIRYFRMSYYKYDLNKKIIPQLESFAEQARKLADVCKELKMTALYQNHAGANYVGAPLWDLMQVLEGIAPEQISVALDLRHTTIEAAESWRAGYARVRDSVGAVFVKDAIHAGEKIDDGPLGRSEKGRQLFQLIQKDHPQIPISLHMEYLDHRKPEMLQQRLDAITADVATLKSWLA